MKFREWLESSQITTSKHPTWGTMYHVDDKEFGTLDQAQEYIKDLETGRNPEKFELWYAMSPEEKDKWALRNLPNWVGMSIAEKNNWLRSVNSDANEKMRIKIKKDEEEAKQKDRDEWHAKLKAKDEANKAAAKYKPKRKYKPGTFYFQSTITNKREPVDGIGDDQLFIHKGQGTGWAVFHINSGLQLASLLPNKGSALAVMDRIRDLDIDWSVSKEELYKIDGLAKKVNQASDLSM